MISEEAPKKQRRLLLHDVNFEKRVLVRRGSRSCFYCVHCTEIDVLLGLKEEKCLEPAVTARNITTIQSLCSDFIVFYHDTVVEDEHRTLVTLTELMDCALSDVIAGDCRRQLTECQMRAVAFLALHALVDLHEKAGMVHADISPSNIFLRAAGGELKLGDVSSALPVGAPVDYFSGTIFYTAVEVLGERNLASSPKSDIWALGATLYECACGRHPFVAGRGANFLEFLLAMESARRAGRRPMCPPCASGDCHDFLCAMLQWDPAQRPTARSLLSHSWFSNFSVAAARQEIALMFS